MEVVHLCLLKKIRLTRKSSSKKLKNQYFVIRRRLTWKSSQVSFAIEKSNKKLFFSRRLTRKSSVLHRLTRKSSVRRLTLKSSKILFRYSGQTLLILDVKSSDGRLSCNSSRKKYFFCFIFQLQN